MDAAAPEPRPMGGPLPTTETPTARDDVPAFSVVIPTRDRARLVVRAIESVLAQRHPASEVIVVDDGSVDDTEARVEALGGPIRYVRQLAQGPSAARNAGVDLARERWVAFLDSDDHWRPEHLGLLAGAIRDTGGRAACYFTDVCRGGRSWWEVAGFTPGASAAGGPVVVDDGTPWMLLPIQPVLPSAAAFDRAVLERVGGFDPTLTTREDTHLLLRLGIGAALCAVPACTVDKAEDVDDAERLTVAQGSSTEVYWRATCYLYDDVLARTPGIPPSARAQLRYRLAAARLRLGRRLLRRSPVRATATIVHGLATDPRPALDALRRRTTRRAGSR